MITITLAARRARTARRVAMTTITIVMCLATAGCHRLGAARPTASTQATGATQSGEPSEPANRTITIATKDGNRQAIVVHPASAGPKPPLVVMLHGGFGSDTQAEKAYGWDDEAAREGFVVAYPNGVDASWNVGDCCGQAQRRGIDDVGFLHALVAQLERTDGVDPNRVYAVGMSNGAMMTYTWACNDPGELAAIGPVAGSLLTPCPHPHPITVVAIHGTADENVPIDGGVGPKGVTGVDNPSLAQTLAPFLAADDCRDSPSIVQAAPITTTVWACSDQHSITTQVVTGAGHQWPGGTPPSAVVARVMGLDQPSDAFNATDFLWQHLRSASTS
jgi:polyhydroxybutyrate depolymerase